MRKKQDGPQKNIKRNKSIFIRVTEKEREEIKLKAEDAGMSISSLMRDHVKKLTVKNREDEQKKLCF